MNEQIQLARRYVRMVWPYRWAALALSMLICVTGWAYVFTLPNVYEVTAKIFVDTRSMLRPLLKGLAIDSNALADTANLMQRTLLTRPNLEEVARKVDLDLTAKTERQFISMVDGLAKKIQLSGTARDNIYEISYTDTNIERSKRVVDELLNRFLETALGSNRKDTAATQKFLDAQIQEYEKRLIEAEEALKNFKQRNVGKMPGEGASYFQDLLEAQVRLKSATLELQEAQKRSSMLRSQLEGEEPVLGIMGDQQNFDFNMSTQYDGRIAALQEQLDQILLRYTEKHPDVTGLREQIEALEERRQVEREAMAAAQAESGASRSGGDSQSSIYQEINLATAQAEAEVAALSARVAAYAKDVEDLERAVDVVPEIEADLTRLNRDYGLNKQRYEELLKRRESARMSEQADEQADDIKLKVIEPPRVPLLPIGPDRVKLISLVLFASLGAGAALAVLLSQINPRFYSSEELKEITQLPVIGTVSLVFSRRQITERRMELAMYGLVLVGLFSVYGGLVALESMQFDLNGKLSSLIGKVT